MRITVTLQPPEGTPIIIKGLKAENFDEFSIDWVERGYVILAIEKET